MNVFVEDKDACKAAGLSTGVKFASQNWLLLDPLGISKTGNDQKNNFREITLETRPV